MEMENYLSEALVLPPIINAACHIHASSSMVFCKCSVFLRKRTLIDVLMKWS